MHDPGDEDDGEMRAQFAHMKAWIKARRAWARPMVVPEMTILYSNYTYSFLRPIVDHDPGDEDRHDIAPLKRKMHPYQTRTNPPRPVR
jgi:hypothetical protein